MNTTGYVAGFSWPRIGMRIFAPLLALFFAAMPLLAYQNAQPPAQAPYAQQTPEQLQQLVAPIALYPDALVAQVLAASTFPEQVVQADRWVQTNPDLKGDALGQAVNQQLGSKHKALTAFPSVLGNMDKNLAWTSSLGDAYYNQQQDVTDAVQEMRQRAQGAGNLKTTPQQTVTDKARQLSFSRLVLRSSMSPHTIHGWFTVARLWRGRDGISTPESGMAAPTSRSDPGLELVSSAALDGAGGTGDSIGTTGMRPLTMAGTTPGATRFTTAAALPEAGRSCGGDRRRRIGQAFQRKSRAARGYAEPRGQSGVRSGAFSNYGHGAQAKSFSSRGSASVGGGARVVEVVDVAAVEAADMGWRWAPVIDASKCSRTVANFEMERNRMRPTKLNFNTSHWTNLPKLAVLVILLTALLPVRSMAQQHGQKTFFSPEDASNALVKAAQDNDEKTMIEILGPDAKQIVSSGDDAEDADSRANFVQKYKEMHRLVKESDESPFCTSVVKIGRPPFPL